MKAAKVIKHAVGLGLGLYIAHQIIGYAGVEMLAVACMKDVIFGLIVVTAKLVHWMRDKLSERGRFGRTLSERIGQELRDNGLSFLIDPVSAWEHVSRSEPQTKDEVLAELARCLKGA
jgi:hypothetical protein